MSDGGDNQTGIVAKFLAENSGTYAVGGIWFRKILWWLIVPIACFLALFAPFIFADQDTFWEQIEFLFAIPIFVYMAYSIHFDVKKIQRIVVSDRGISFEPMGHSLGTEDILEAEIQSTQKADVICLKVRKRWFFPHLSGVWAWNRTVRIAFGKGWLTKYRQRRV